LGHGKPRIRPSTDIYATRPSTNSSLNRVPLPPDLLSEGFGLFRKAGSGSKPPVSIHTEETGCIRGGPVASPMQRPARAVWEPGLFLFFSGMGIHAKPDGANPAKIPFHPQPQPWQDSMGNGDQNLGPKRRPHEPRGDPPD